MIKTYKLTTPVRSSSIVLRGKTNNSLRYNFAGGDPVTGKPATIMLRSQYAQDLLEQSELYANGYVVLVRADEGGEKPVVKKKVDPELVKEDITSPEQLLEFVNVTLDPPSLYKQPKFALAYAEKKGYQFPNLKISEDK
jgi:hypothetical protein